MNERSLLKDWIMESQNIVFFGGAGVFQAEQGVQTGQELLKELCA